MKGLNRNGRISGSALIMTVVLTVLLSMVGMMFIMIARMDKASTSSVIENKELKAAVDSVVEIISQQLVLDTPGVAGQEYYDYPGDKDEWLASIEPYLFDDNGTPSDPNDDTYYWPQISDVTDTINKLDQQDVDTDPPGTRKTILEYQDADDVNKGEVADADGDGIVDSKWIELDMRTSKGRKVYAAVRVIDNSAMLNVNTAYEFDDANNPEDYEIDGSTQGQINLASLIKDPCDTISYIHEARSDVNQSAWSGNFKDKVIWNFGVPYPDYPQFEISDELEMRYRYCIDGQATTRLEEVWPDTVGGDSEGAVSVPYDGSTGGTDRGIVDWQQRICNYTFAEADRRHLLTTYNLDRVIDPNGDKMFSVRVNRDAQALYDRLKSSCINPAWGPSDPERQEQEAYLAQICANIVDYSDDDANVSVVTDENGDEYYGFERPFIYISEIVRNFQRSRDSNDPNIYRSYAVELYKPFSSNEKFDDWELRIGSRVVPIKDYYFEERGGNYYVIVYENSIASLADEVEFSDSPNNGANGVDPEVILRWDQTWFDEDGDGNDIFSDSYDVYFGTNAPPPFIRNQKVTSADSNNYYDPYGAGSMATNTTYYWRVDAWYNKGGDPNDPCDLYKTRYQKGSVWSFTTWETEPNSIYAWTDPCDANDIILKDGDLIRLHRDVDVGGSIIPIMVDYQTIPLGFEDITKSGILGYRRDIGRNNRLKRIWDPNLYDGSTLGHWNGYSGSSANPIQPFHSEFKTIGEIGKVFRKSTYIRPSHRFNYFDIPPNIEKDVRIDLQDPNMQRIFQYLTVMDPDRFYLNDANETRVKGRLNINTAPKFLIQQLPWVTSELAEAIVAYRDMTQVASDNTIDYSDRNDATGLDADIYPLGQSRGISNICELISVINDTNKDEYSIQKYGLDNNRDQRGFPDLTTNGRSRDDGAADDLEEKELIFARISDLVTVRSDVFTAYVLVRLGTDGPQKRAVAIFDRSGVNDETDRVKIRALQLTPEAR